jgi:tetratricopeptide (TPR) repeat protein
VGNDFLKEEQYDSAKVAFKRGIEMNEEYASNYLGVARVLENEGSFMDALNAFVKYGEISKKEGDEKRTEDAYKRAKNMVVKLYIDKDYANVAKVGESYLASDLNSDVAYYVGKSHAELGAHSDAVNAYQKSIEASEKMSEAIDDKVYYAIGESYEAQNMSSQAIEAYKKISDDKYKAQAEYRIGKLSGE